MIQNKEDKKAINRYNRTKQTLISVRDADGLNSGKFQEIKHLMNIL